MKYYVVVGQDQIYSGLHGMLEVEIITANDFEEALNYAEELTLLFSNWILFSNL